MNRIPLFLLLMLCFSCQEKKQAQQGEVSAEFFDSVANNSPTRTDSIAIPEARKTMDVDTISVTSKVVHLIRNLGDNRFNLRIELPAYGKQEVDMKILQWINNNLEEEITDTLDADSDADNLADFNAYKAFYNQKYEGDMNNVRNLALFYADKHFGLYPPEKLGIDHKIECLKVYESKDVVSYEITEFFCDYGLMKSKTSVRGTTFFKYNGERLSWAMFENSNVKDVAKKEVNVQFLKLSDDNYQSFLNTTKYQEFSLPSQPPYMTRNGLKFIYKSKELSEKEADEQIYCIIPLDKLSLSPKVADLLQ